MRFKAATTVTLLSLVAASIVTPLVRQWRDTGRSASATVGEPAPCGDRLVLYYFHGKVACRTCNRIEAFAHEAVEQGFAGQLADGSIEWRVVDYQQPGNEHFIEDYHLVASSVVLVQMRGGVRRRSKNLVDVWQFVEDRQSAVRYVQDELRVALSDLGGDE